jgi:hypothetical protein
MRASEKFLDEEAAAAALPPPEEGHGLIDDVRAFVGEHVAFPSHRALDAVALWVVHTHALDAFESTPRLVLVSPEKQTGKTRTLEVCELLVPKAMHSVNATTAAVFRAVARDRPVLLFDEADTYFGPRAQRDYEDLRGLVNAGHRRGAVAWRVVGEGKSMEVRPFPAFAAVAVAGIGELPETILDRAVVVRMRRRAPTEQLTPFRYRKARPRGEALRDRIAAWARHHLVELAEAEPEMPAGIADRPADVWESLLALADLAGGDWPERGRAAAVELEAVRRSASVSQGTQLLADVRSVFEQNGVDRIGSEDLCARLAELDESPWGDLRGRAIDPRGLAARLRPYDVRPHEVRFGEGTRKGYLLGDFHEAWTRYLPHPPESATSATGEASATETEVLTSDVADVAAVADLGEGKATVADSERNRLCVRCERYGSDHIGEHIPSWAWVGGP